MYNVRKIQEDLFWVGANDRRLAKFENVHPIPEGTSYNSYVLLDDKTVLFDTADKDVSEQFLENIKHVLGDRELDYIVVNHIEPDHGASLANVLKEYPKAQVVSTKKADAFMKQFGFCEKEVQIVKEGDSLSFGKHNVTFYMATMVHWPEVMVTYDETTKTLFSADAFGAFGALDGKIFADETGLDAPVDEYMRRYYTNIVGKYGPQVQKVLAKAANLDIEMICPLHGPVFRTQEDIEWIVSKYDLWSRYVPEEKGVLICYASMYGGTAEAADILGRMLCERGVTEFEVHDVSRTDHSLLISKAFRYSNLAFLSVTYNMGLFPVMHSLIHEMQGLNLQNRTVAIVENGTWAPASGKVMTEMVSSMKNMTILEEGLSIKSRLTEDNLVQLEKLADAIVESMK